MQQDLMQAHIASQAETEAGQGDPPSHVMCPPSHVPPLPIGAPPRMSLQDLKEYRGGISCLVSPHPVSNMYRLLRPEVVSSG